MAAKSGVYIQGLREITRGMEKAGVDVEELKDVMGRIADEATRIMQPLIPKRSGALRASARGNRAKGKAVVTITARREADRIAGILREISLLVSVDPL